MDGFLNPIEVLDQLELRKDIIAADFGSGSGGWVLPLAKRLKAGKVYAIDILEEPLSALKGKARAEGLLNIEIIRSNLESKKGSKLKDTSCDLVLMTNLLFEAEDKEIILKEAKRVLKKRGRVLIVDWRAETFLGPKEKISAIEVKKMAEKLNLKLEKELKAGSHHYGLLFTKL